jgi:adenylosuccinate synthase
MIGPTYSSKMTRSGLRVCDIFDEATFEAKFRRVVHGYQKRFGDLLKYDPEAEIEKFRVTCTSLIISYPTLTERC